MSCFSIEILAISTRMRTYPLLDEIVDLLTETVCASKQYLTIAGYTFPSAVVKSRPPVKRVVCTNAISCFYWSDIYLCVVASFNPTALI